MRALLIGGLALAASSCTHYRSAFDGAPGRGVPNASVTEIESMIVEADDGPDFLAPGVDDYYHNRPRSLPSALPSEVDMSGMGDRVWVAPSRTREGHIIGAHYVELSAGQEASHA